MVKRPIRYSSQDGVSELMLGLFLAVTAGIFLLPRVLPKGSVGAGILGMAPVALWIGATFGFRWGMKKLKEDVTSLRGGYVALREPSMKFRVVCMVLGALIAGGWAVLLARRGGEGLVSSLLGAPGIAVVFGIGLLMGGIQYRLPHRIWLAAFSWALGGLLYELRVSSGLWTMIWMGAALAATGGFRLWQFLKANPRIEGADL